MLPAMFRLMLVCLRVVHGVLTLNDIVQPSTAAIQTNLSERSYTASVLFERWLLTAAHCVEPSHRNLGGAVCVGKTTPHGKVHSYVRRVIQHPAYRSKPYLPVHDIAVVRVEPQLKNFQAVQLYGVEQSPLGKKLLKAGYGKCVFGPQRFTVRMGAQTRSPCSTQAIGAAQFAHIIFSTKERICPGDSGGPLFAGSFSSLKQVAVNSGRCPDYCTNISCECAQHPSV